MCTASMPAPAPRRAMSISSTTLAKALRTNRIRLRNYLSELESRFNEREPDALAFVPEQERFVRLEREAIELERRNPDPAARPPLFGMPVGVKDIIHVAGIITGAGADVPQAELQGEEAVCVSSLKSAGALILGKTVTTCYSDLSFAPGPTRNPHNPEYTPGGSSSGSAAGVAAGLCGLALGTQTGGSLTRPAAYCGVVGFKPSYNRISCAGVVPLAPSLDHVGLIAADVKDVLFSARVLCRTWQAPPPGRRPSLGIPIGPYLDCTSREGEIHFRKICDRLQAAEFHLIKVEAFSDFESICERHGQLVAAEAASSHRDRLSHNGTPLPELIRLGEKVSSELLAVARAGRDSLRRELAALMDAHNIDMWIAPATTGPAPPGLENTGNPVMNLPWTYSGLPTLTLPSGVNQAGLPLGLQLAAGWYADESLLAWGSEIESLLRSPR